VATIHLAPAAPTAEPVVGADTVLPASIMVNGLPLVVRRAELRQQLGPADSTYTAPTPTSDPAYCFGDAQLPEPCHFERYGASIYWQQGDTLTFLQTRRGGAPLRVQIGPHHISERTTRADLQRMFPASYENEFQRGVNGQQLFVLYPPAPLAAGAWYTLIIENGHVAQFLNVYNCTFD
jgi:hypothetical protein